MSRAYGDPVQVWLVDGRPSRFVWQGRLYTVLRVLDHWVTTRDWWRDRNPDAKEATAREFWQVEATPDEASEGWMLSRAWD